MKKLIFGFLVMMTFAGTSLPALADGCYICSGGSYVKYSGQDNGDKRKAAKQCGCEVSGTRGDCSAANLKVLCSVKAEEDTSYKIALEDFYKNRK